MTSLSGVLENLALKIDCSFDDIKEILNLDLDPKKTFHPKYRKYLEPKQISGIELLKVDFKDFLNLDEVKVTYTELLKKLRSSKHGSKHELSQTMLFDKINSSLSVVQKHMQSPIVFGLEDKDAKSISSKNPSNKNLNLSLTGINTAQFGLALSAIRENQEGDRSEDGEFKAPLSMRRSTVQQMKSKISFLSPKLMKTIDFTLNNKVKNQIGEKHVLRFSEDPGLRTGDFLELPGPEKRLRKTGNKNSLDMDNKVKSPNVDGDLRLNILTNYKVGKNKEGAQHAGGFGIENQHFGVEPSKRLIEEFDGGEDRDNQQPLSTIRPPLYTNNPSDRTKNLGLLRQINTALSTFVQREFTEETLNLQNWKNWVLEANKLVEFVDTTVISLNDFKPIDCPEDLLQKNSDSNQYNLKVTPAPGEESPHKEDESGEKSEVSVDEDSIQNNSFSSMKNLKSEINGIKKTLSALKQNENKIGKTGQQYEQKMIFNLNLIDNSSPIKPHYAANKALKFDSMRKPNALGMSPNFASNLKSENFSLNEQDAVENFILSTPSQTEKVQQIRSLSEKCSGLTLYQTRLHTVDEFLDQEIQALEGKLQELRPEIERLEASVTEKSIILKKKFEEVSQYDAKLALLKTEQLSYELNHKKVESNLKELADEIKDLEMALEEAKSKADLEGQKYSLLLNQKSLLDQDIKELEADLVVKKKKVTEMKEAFLKVFRRKLEFEKQGKDCLAKVELFGNEISRSAF